MKTKTLVFMRSSNPEEEIDTKLNETVKELEDKDCFIKDIKLSTSASETAIGNVLIYTYLILYEEKKP